MMKVFDIIENCEAGRNLNLRPAFKVSCNHDTNRHGHLHVRKDLVDPWLKENEGKTIKAYYSDSFAIRLNTSIGTQVSIKDSSNVQFYHLPEMKKEAHFPELTCLRLELE